MDTNLSGRTALITGGSQGLGLAMAESFYQSGARVAILVDVDHSVSQFGDVVDTLAGTGPDREQRVVIVAQEAD